MRVLFIGGKQEEILHGWDQVNKRNQVVLESVFDVVNYIPFSIQTLGEKVYIGITRDFLSRLDSTMANNQYDYVFVCQSSCGRVCKYIKKRYPGVRIITFFHNVERVYAYQYFKVSGIKAIPYFLRAYYFEKMAVTYSDYCITLNERDSNLLESIYGKTADAIMPTSLEDRFQIRCSLTDKKDEIIDYLFVGTAFYPNIEGVQWFIDNVLPKVKGRFTVVGKDMREDLFSNLNDRVSILGFVEDLSDYYRRARCVVSPIFHGGGMKTKTAEALMYGKYIIATKEALEGYMINNISMRECNNAKDFIEAIKENEKQLKTFYSESREVFIKHLSYSSSVEIFKDMIYHK